MIIFDLDIYGGGGFCHQMQMILSNLLANSTQLKFKEVLVLSGFGCQAKWMSEL